MTRKTINQRIALEGGKEIRDELKALGEAGEKAFDQIQDAASARSGFAAEFGKSIANLRAEVGKLGPQFSKFRGDLARVGTEFGKVTRNIGIFSAAAAAAVTGIVGLTRSGVEAAREIEQLSKVANATPESFQRWSAAAATVGVEQDKLADILKDTGDKVGDFLQTGGGPMADFFEKIAPKVGVTAEQFRNLSGPEALQLYVSSLEKANLSQAEMTFYLEALASDATLLLPLLRGNGAEMARLGIAAERLGNVMSSDAIAGLTDADEALTETGRTVGTLRLQLAAIFAPAVAEGARAFTRFIAENREAITGFAEYVRDRAVPIIRDLFNTISGNDADVQTKWLLDIRDGIISIGSTAVGIFQGVVVPAFNAVTAAADLLAAAVNGIFGTDFTGEEVIVAAVIAKIVGAFGLLTAAVSAVYSGVVLMVQGFGLLAPIGAAVAATFSAIVAGVQVVLTALAGLISWPALLVAALVAGAIAVYAYWEEIKAAAGAAWEYISELWGQFGKWLATKFGEGAELLLEGWQAITDGADAAWAWITEGAVQLWDTLQSGWGVVVDAAGNAWAWISNGAIDLWGSIRDGASSAWSYLRDGFGSLAQWLSDLFDGVVSRITSAWNSIKSLASSAASAARSIFDDPEPMGPVQGYSVGGYVRGAGTGTSDSILARLSNGEFVMRAAAVRHYGPQLLDALNRLRLPRLPGFAAGGLVQGMQQVFAPQMPALLPRFADGGMVSIPATVQGRPLSLTIDSETFSGLTAPEDVADRLVRFATGRVLRSAGRKPGWV